MKKHTQSDLQNRIKVAKEIVRDMNLEDYHVLDVVKLLQKEDEIKNAEDFIKAFKKAHVILDKIDAPAALEAIAMALGMTPRP